MAAEAVIQAMLSPGWWAIWEGTAAKDLTIETLNEAALREVQNTATQWSWLPPPGPVKWFYHPGYNIGRYTTGFEAMGTGAPRNQCPTCKAEWTSGGQCPKCGALK
jgi:hypothetical protein